MYMRKELRNTVHTALITAFTIAAALIWKDVIVLFVRAILPRGGTLLAEFTSAIIATLLVLFAIAFVLIAEEEVEDVVEEVEEFAHTWRGKRHEHREKAYSKQVQAQRPETDMVS